MVEAGERPVPSIAQRKQLDRPRHRVEPEDRLPLPVELRELVRDRRGEQPELDEERDDVADVPELDAERGEPERHAERDREHEQEHERARARIASAGAVP